MSSQLKTETRASFETDGAHRVRDLIYYGFHATALLAFWSGVSWWALGLCFAMYYVRMFFVTGALHRYFAHKTYRTSRWFQFLLALGSTTALQKGVLWWAGHHRNHHTFSDTPQDVHSPRQRGFWYSHMGWVADPATDATPYDKVPDLAKYPELRWLNHNYILVFTAMCVLTFFTLGFQALVWGCFISTIVLWHGTFTINSFGHIWGKRVYRTDDDSRNSFFFALVTMGEGWHNNHHFYPAAAHQGFRWWEVDMTWYLLVVLEKLGLIWGLRRAPQSVIEGRLGRKNYLIAEVGDNLDEPAPAQAEAEEPEPAVARAA